MSEPREFPIVAGPGFKWNTHEPIVGPAPVRDTSVTVPLARSNEGCHPIPLRDSSFVDNYTIPIDESTGWQEIGWIDEAYSFPSMREIQQRMNERVLEAIDRLEVPALIREPDNYSISWRDPSPIETEVESFGELLRPTAVEELVARQVERYYSNGWVTRYLTGMDPAEDDREPLCEHALPAEGVE